MITVHCDEDWMHEAPADVTDADLDKLWDPAAHTPADASRGTLAPTTDDGDGGDT